MSVFLLPKSAKVWSNISTRSFNQLRSTTKIQLFSTSQFNLNNDKESDADFIERDHNDSVYKKLDPKLKNQLEREQRTLQDYYNGYEDIKIPKLIAPIIKKPGESAWNGMDAGTFIGKNKRINGDFANSSLKAGIEKEIAKIGNLPNYNKELVNRVDDLLEFYGIEKSTSSNGLTPDQFLYSLERQFEFLLDPKESDLYKFISDIDKKFIQIFSDENTNPVELLNYVNNEKNRINKLINNNNNNDDDFTKLVNLLNQEIKPNPSILFLSSLNDAFSNIEIEAKDSNLFKTISEIDPKFADLLINEETSFDTLVKYLEDKRHALSKIISEKSSDEYNKLEKLITNSITEEINLNSVDSFLTALTFYADQYGDDLINSELFKYINELDENFANLMINPETDDTKLIKYLENKENIISQIINNEESIEFSKIHELLLKEPTLEPGEILLNNINDILADLENLESSQLFNKLSEIDPIFAKLIKEQKGEEEIEEYIQSGNAPIINILQNPESKEFKSLEEEVTIANRIVLNPASNVSLEEVLNYKLDIIDDADKSAIFNKVMKIIDPSLSTLLDEYSLVVNNNLSNEEIDVQEKLELKEEIVNYIEDPHNENVYNAFHNEGSFANTLLVKLLNEQQQQQQPKQEESNNNNNLDINKAQELLKLEDASKIELEYKKEKLKNLNSKISQLLEEDQSNLDSNTKISNETFDLFIETMTDLQKEFETKGLNKLTEFEKKENLKYFQEITNAVSTEQLNEMKNSRIEGKFIRTTNKDRILNLCVNLMMRKGKKSLARKYLNRALYLIYLEKRTNPVELFKNALDTLAPLVSTKTTQQAFSSRRTTIPIPLTEKKRFRMAFLWILEASDNRASSDFEVRLSEEILNVANGTSPLMEKKHLNHRTAMVNRSYLKLNKR